MSKFNTTTQKLRKLWEKISQNTTDLNNISNEDQLSFFSNLSQQQINKNIIEIADTDFFIATIEEPDDAFFSTTDAEENILTTSVNENTELPQPYSYQKEFNLELPEEFLPFVKIVPEVSNIPSHKLSLGGKFVSSRFSVANDIITMRGDGALLYQGSPQDINSDVPRINTLLSAFTSTELSDFSIPLANTKKIFKATVNYTLAGETFEIIGNLTRLDAFFDVGTGCNGNTNRDQFDANVFQEDGSGERGDNEFLGLTATTFSIKSKKTEIRFVDIPPCTQQNSTTNGVTKSASFGATSSYELVIVGSHKNLTTEEFLGNNQTVIIDTSNSTINSQTFEDIGQRAYYSSATEGVLSIDETGNSDGNFLKEIRLDPDNLPNTSKGHTLPYIQIIFQRNFQTFDREVFETDEYIQHSKKKLPVFFKKSDNNFFVNFVGDFLLVSPATVIDINSRQFPKYNDFYTVSGTTYIVTTTNHSFLDSETDTQIYTPEITDPQVRIKLFLQNILHWREERKYDI